MGAVAAVQTSFPTSIPVEICRMPDPHSWLPPLNALRAFDVAEPGGSPCWPACGLRVGVDQGTASTDTTS
jgi:hypothetical protein